MLIDLTERDRILILRSLDSLKSLYEKLIFELGNQLGDTREYKNEVVKIQELTEKIKNG